MKVHIEAHTCAKGKNSNTDEERMVIINNLAIGKNNQNYFPGEPFQGELRAFYDPYGYSPGSWHNEAYGLICGDRLWLKEFKAGLRSLGLNQKAVQNVKYNDVILQGNDYVSLEVGQNFWVSWQRLQKIIEQKAVNDTFLVNA